MKFNERTYIIGKHFLPALINGDYTGMEDHEDQALDAFLERVACKGHWSYADEGENFTRCEVSGLYADCVTVTAYDPAQLAQN